MAIGDLFCVESTDGATSFRIDSSGNIIASGTIGLTTDEGASIYLSDSATLGFGDAQDLTVAHDGTNTVFTSSTGDLVFDNVDTNDQIILRVGTDTTATGVEFRNNSDVACWAFNPTGAATGRLIGLDNCSVILGTGSDFTGLHDGTNTLLTSITGNLVIDNQAATGATFLDMGTDTSATKVAIRNNSGTELLAVTADAALASLCAMTTTDGVSSGTARKIGGVASCITAAGTSHTNSTDEAVLASYTIPANTIKAGTFVRCRFLARVTADNGATTLTGRLRLGATTLTGTELIVSSAVDTGSGHIFEGEFVLVGRAAPGAAAAVVGCGSFADPGAAGGTRITANLNSTNFATNGALRLELTADWSAADANAVQAEIFVVEVIG